MDIEGGQAADEFRRDFQGADAGVAELNAELAETDRELDQIRRPPLTGRDGNSTGGASACHLRFKPGWPSLRVRSVRPRRGGGVVRSSGSPNDAIHAASDFEEVPQQNECGVRRFLGRDRKSSPVRARKPSVSPMRKPSKSPPRSGTCSSRSASQAGGRR